MAAPQPVAPPVAPTPAPTETGDTRQPEAEAEAEAEVETGAEAGAGAGATHSWRPQDLGGDVGEDTRNLDLPDAAQLVGAMLELVSSEAEALLEGTGSDEKLAELNVRTALASWDALHQTDEALRFLELADGHPLAPRLRFAAALAAGDSAMLQALEARVRDAPELMLELAEAYLWRYGRIDRALPLLEKLVATDMPAPWRAHAVELAALALAAQSHWDRVTELRCRGLDEDSEPEEVAAAAALQLDRVGDATAALATCWSKLETYPGVMAIGSNALGWLRTLDVATDAATILDDDRRFELLDKRAELVSSLPAGAVEALATRHALASELDRAAQHAEAAAQWMRLADDAGAALPGAARRVALLRAAWSGVAAGPPHALAARRALADSECTTVAAAHAWRALELAGVLDETSLPDLARAVADVTSSPIAERWLDQLELMAPSAATASRFETRGGLGLRWAAAIAERHGDRARAIGLWKRASADSMLPTTRDHVVRLLRGDGSGDAESYADGDDLAAAYARWASAEPDQRSAAALWCARGIVDLARGDFVEAEDSLAKAAALAPADPFSRAALAAVYRAGKRYELLARTLAELTESLTSPTARAQVAREHATLLDEHLGDPAGARVALEGLLRDRPEDLEVVIALATLCERERDFERAIALRRHGTELASTRERRAQLWGDVARLEEARGDRDAALVALDRASEAAPGEAMREQARLHRASGRLDRVVDVLRKELDASPTLGRRMELQRELATTLTTLGIDPAAVVTAYLDVLGIEPDQAEALAGLEAPARQLGLWDELARAFRGAPRTAKNLEVLAEALVHTSEWSELVEVRRSQMDAATSPPEKARRAGELAALYESELGDVDGAIRHLQLAQTLQLDDARQQHLLRLLRVNDRWADIATALERELPAVKPGDTDRQIGILHELGSLRANHLDKLPEAAAAYESILERRPNEPTAEAALEKLYERLGRDRELARLLDVRAEAATDPTERAALFARVAALRHTRGDIDGALAAYTAAFKADPTNRDVFTAMEKVCYQAERWAVAMQLYESAIAHVESGASRAYRLGDLYSRRGNVQLGFLGQVDAAIASFQKVVEVDSQPAAAVKSLEELVRKRGNIEPLIAAWVQRAEYQKDLARKSEALRAASALAAEEGDSHRAMDLQLKLLALDPADATAARHVEKFYEDAQDKSGLVDVLKMQLQHTTGDAAVALMKRIARASEEGARDVETATEHYMKMLEVEPENKDALEALGRIYETTEQWAELVESTRRLIKVTADRTTKALLYFRCGSVMEAKFGREADAIRYYEAAIKTAPSCLPAVHGLRDLYRRREDWARVIETLELEVKLWQDDKERAGVFAQIGGVYAQQLGDSERALQFFDSALAVDADCLPANQALFEHFFAQRAWDKAQPIANALAQKAMRDGDPNTRSEFYRKRGVVSRMTGDLRGAADSFIVALEVRPTNAAALDDLGTLAREHPDVWDFEQTYRELEKVYKKRDDTDALQARVHVGRAVIIEREGDLDQAAGLYQQALELAPGDVVVMSALVDFHADMRRWEQAIAAIEVFISAASTSPDDRISALMRRAAIHADGEMDSQRAMIVLREVLRLDPSHQDAHYQLAQQYFLEQRYAEARGAIDRVIELATAPGLPLSPSALARYYYYKGRIVDAAGDSRAAASQYRRATEYDPGYAPPALVLARRAADANDRATAESLLIEAAHAAMARGGAQAAVPLQRGLARMLLASGDRPAAIEAYRGILAVEPGSASDRVALAEIYAVDDPQRAITELRKVIDRDIHHAPAYRLLATYYNRVGDAERATRVLTALDLLGFAEEVDRHTSRRMRASRVTRALRQSMTEDTRARFLLTPSALSPMGEVFAAFAEQLSAFIPPPSLGTNIQPAIAVGETRLLQLANEVSSLLEIDADIYVGERVPGLAAVTAFPRRMIVLDRQLLTEEDGPLRFLFGYALEAIRGGYAALLNIGARHRRELAQLLFALLSPDGQVMGPAADLVESAAMRMSVQQMLERVSTPDAQELDPSIWIDGMLALAKRAGLVACDDFAPAIWMVARLSGETMTSPEDSVALGAVLGGPDLVRFYLSDDYQALRDLLTL